VERLVVSPASRDLISRSQRLISSAPETGLSRTVVGDRAYSNLLEDNWYSFLSTHGYDQVVDMREDNQTWTDVDGMRVTAGWCHCPATPDELEAIPRPSLGINQEFLDTIALRQNYAVYIKESTPEKRRVQCPALACQVRCPLRPESLVLPATQPLIDNPPDLATAPRICTQDSVTIYASNPNARARLWQKYYWGSKKQVEWQNRRTSVEQKFSRVKDRQGTDMSKGFVRVPGLAAMTLAVGLVFVASNMKDLRTWVDNGFAREDVDLDHPLLAESETAVHVELDRDALEALTLLANHREEFQAFLAAQQASAAKESPEDKRVAG